MPQRWYNRPQNLQRIFIGQLGFVGLGALEGSRRLLNGDLQWYLGASGDNPRPDSRWDKFWSSTFGETSGDSFVTPEKDAKPGQKRLRDGKGKQISPPEKSMKRKREIDFNPAPAPTRPNKIIALSMSRENATGGPGSEDPIQPFTNPPNVINDVYTFKGRNVFQAVFQLGDRSAADGSVSTPPSLGTSQVLSIRVNAPGDPNLTVSANNSSDNNRPINGWDIWKTHFTHYSVISTKINVQFFRKRKNPVQLTAVSGSTYGDFYDDAPMVVGFICDPSNRFGAAEVVQRGFKSLLLGPHVAHQYLMGGERCNFSYTYTPNMWDSAIENAQEDGIWTVTSLNPTTLDYMHFFASPTNAFCTGEIDVIVEMETTVQMKQLTIDTLKNLYMPEAWISTADVAAPTPTAT